MPTTLLRLGALALALFLGGCANQSMPGYQRVYQGYQVPQVLVDAVQNRLRVEGLGQAVIGRDTVGRLRLNGNYRNEDDVERAFIVTQSIVGIESTSPFYPENVREKRWEREAGAALAEFYKRRKQAQDEAPGKKRALVIGINKFLDPMIPDIQGEDDALVMSLILANYGYDVMSLLGARATKSNIESTIAELDRTMGPKDTLFIYVSSHGSQPVPTPSGNDERRMSIITYDSGFANVPKALRVDTTSYLLKLQSTSVRDTLIQALAQKPSAVTRVIIDTCYSGEILKDLPSAGAGYQQKLNGGTYEKASVSEASWTGASFTSKSIAVVDNERRATAPALSGKTSDFAARKNYTFITATGPGEKSYGPNPSVGTFALGETRGEPLRGSFFTQSFLAYLKQFSGDVPQAFEAARDFTSKKVSQVTNGLPQNPRRFTTIPAEVDNLAKF